MMFRLRYKMNIFFSRKKENVCLYNILYAQSVILYVGQQQTKKKNTKERIFHNKTEKNPYVASRKTKKKKICRRIKEIQENILLQIYVSYKKVKEMSKKNVENQTKRTAEKSLTGRWDAKRIKGYSANERKFYLI